MGHLGMLVFVSSSPECSMGSCSLSTAIQYAAAMGLRVLAIGMHFSSTPHYATIHLRSFPPFHFLHPPHLLLLYVPQSSDFRRLCIDTGSSKKSACLSRGAEHFIDFQECIAAATTSASESGKPEAEKSAIVALAVVKEIVRVCGGVGPHAAVIISPSVRAIFCFKSVVTVDICRWSLYHVAGVVRRCPQVSPAERNVGRCWDPD